MAVLNRDARYGVAVRSYLQVDLPLNARLARQRHILDWGVRGHLGQRPGPFLPPNRQRADEVNRHQ